MKEIYIENIYLLKKRKKAYNGTKKMLHNITGWKDELKVIRHLAYTKSEEESNFSY